MDEEKGMKRKGKKKRVIREGGKRKGRKGKE